jgi:hypothetical protein
VVVVASLQPTCTRVHGGLAAKRHEPTRCFGAEGAWASSGSSILTHCVSGLVGLDWPP